MKKISNICGFIEIAIYAVLMIRFQIYVNTVGRKWT